MLPDIVDADEEHEEAVLKLFQANGIAVQDAFWARAFADEASGWPVVALRGGKVIGYVALRRRALHLDGEYHDALILHDLLVEPGEDGEQAARMFLEHLPRRAVISFAVGWSTYGVALLREWHWSFAGPMIRLRMPGIRRRKMKPPELLTSENVPPEMHQLNDELAHHERVFFARHSGYDRQMSGPESAEYNFLPLFPEGGLAAGYLKLQKCESLDGRGEWQVVDVAASDQDGEVLCQRLKELASGGLSVYLSMMCRVLTDQLVKEGAERLQPRWGVFWALGDTRHSDIARRLSETKNWFLTPTDFDLDYTR